MQQASINTTVIDGVSYSTKPTPYGIFTIRFFEFLPNGGMSAHSRTCWLLYFNEPTPPKILAEPSGTLQIPGPPGPLGDAMINGWLYSQVPTNFTEFTLPPSTTKCWTETAFEPIPANASPGLSTSHLRFVFSLILLSILLALRCLYPPVAQQDSFS